MTAHSVTVGETSVELTGTGKAIKAGSRR